MTRRAREINQTQKLQPFFSVTTPNAALATVSYRLFQLGTTSPAQTAAFAANAGGSLHPDVPSFLNSICGIISWLSTALFSGLTHHASGRAGRRGGGGGGLPFDAVTLFLRRLLTFHCITPQNSGVSPVKCVLLTQPSGRQSVSSVLASARTLPVSKENSHGCCGFMGLYPKHRLAVI